MVRAIAVVLLVACSGGGGAGADAPTGGDGGESDVDGPTGAGGLTFQLVARPALPGVGGSVQVSEIKIWLRDVRAIGDSAPGDSRTSRTQVELDYRSDRDPDAIAFPLAPPGLYSDLDARLGDGSNGFELRGTVTVGAMTYQLEIVDEEASGAISVPLGGLRVDKATVATVAMDLSFLAGIDWAAAPKDGDKIALDSDSAITVQVRDGLLAAFGLVP